MLAVLINGIRKPSAVVEQIANTVQVVFRIVRNQGFCTFQPLCLADLMAKGRHNGIVLTAPGYFGQKLRNNPAILCLFDMLAKYPPAKVVDFFQGLIRAID